MKWIILAFIIGWTIAAQAVLEPAVDTPANRKILTEIEGAYNRLRTLKASFAQFNSKMKDDLQTGTLYLARPGRLRLVYEKGSPLEFYAVDGYLIYHDRDAREVSYFELAQTPVEWILKDRLYFDDPAFVVTDVQDILDEYTVTAHKKDARDLGSLTLVIDKETMTLKQWEILDMQGVTSTVSLFNTQPNIPVDKTLFIFQNPYK